MYIVSGNVAGLNRHRAHKQSVSLSQITQETAAEFVEDLLSKSHVGLSNIVVESAKVVRQVRHLVGRDMVDVPWVSFSVTCEIADIEAFSKVLREGLGKYKKTGLGEVHCTKAH